MQSFFYTLAYSAPGFLFAVIIHEYAHGWMAKRFGDSTAEDAGRLTFNPAPHIDPLGTVVFPMIGVYLGFVFGWARPVPINSRNFSDYKKGLFWVSFAGPLSNIIFGTVAAIIAGVVYGMLPETFSLKIQLIQMLRYTVLINFLLAFFNLIPLPPLDGSNMIMPFLSYDAANRYQSLRPYFNLILIGSIALGYMGLPSLTYIFYGAHVLGETLFVYFLRLFGS